MNIKGKTHKFGDNVDTDVIIPARYLNTTDPAELARHCMEDIDPKFSRAVKAGDVIVAGRNFGCGSSREHAPISIKAAGVSCVVASSFARIFYRNAINTGLPILECPEAAAAVAGGNDLEIDLVSGRIADRTSGKTFEAKPFPGFILDIIREGGLMGYLKKQSANNARSKDK
jgi:3-isopropylmalate/(R)-2-methylmalate dehydratase small subunit